MSSKNISGYVLTALFAAGVGAVGAWAAFSLTNQDKLELAEDMAIYSECREIISEKGDPDFDDAEALNGWLEAGGDEYTYYFEYNNADPIVTQTDYVNSSGTAKASGFQVECDESGNILLTEVETGLAASKAGLQSGDVITEIDGISVIEAGYSEIVTKLMGKQDTTAKLKIQRGEELLELDFVRDNEYLREAQWRSIDEVGYIHIDMFLDLTDGYVSKALDELNCNKCIIDLRDCPGGDGDTAMNTVALFIDEGYVVKDYFGRSSTRLDVKTGSKIFDGEIILLVNENTASAAELFTSLLKQYGESVTIVGENSFGKGIFQQSEELSDGGKLNYTAGYYKVGEWENFHGKGVAPDVEIPMSSELIGTDEDIQLEKALELLK